MKIDDVVSFWFGAAQPDAIAARRQEKLWWAKDPDSDARLRDRFGDAVRDAAAGKLAGWSQTATGRLALILLLDQLPRNIYRGTAAAFATDSSALALCLDGLKSGADKVLRPIQRVFFYLPLEHAESLTCQDLSVRYFSELAESITGDAAGAFANYLEFAQRHRAVIARFGRFPHRNAVLGRQSSEEEQAFLREPGSSF